MNATLKPDTVTFGTKGQVVIPRRLRREFEVEIGTKATVVSTPEGILLKPITAASIRRLRGLLKRKPGSKTFAEEMAEYKRGEIQLEEAKYARSTGSR